MATILVFSGCHNKMQLTWWLKQQKFISHSFGDWQVQDEGAVSVPGEDSLPGLQTAAFLLCPEMVERERKIISCVST